jgi:YD repeat-containing protein
MAGTARLFRTIAGLLVLLLGQMGSLPAHATLDKCKGFSATGSWECVTSPQVLTPWRWSVPGPIASTRDLDSADAAIVAYKEIIAASGGTLCGLVGALVSPLDTQWSQPGPWDFNRLYIAQRFPARFDWEVRLGSGTTGDPYFCSPRSAATYLYSFRDHSCLYQQGWYLQTDDPRSRYCAKLDTFEDRTCPTANPVLPGSGVKLLSSTDYTGAGAHPLQFSRSYRSRWARAELTASMGGIANSTGRTGWLHSYERQIADVPFAPTALRRAIRADGSVNTFTATANAQGVIQWQAEAGVRDTLTPTAAGWDYKVFADDSVERYDSQGRLLSITERNGWVTTLTYSTATTPVDVAPKPGLLIRVANHFGRALTFGYEQSGRLAALIDPAGGAVRYGYDGFGNLASVTWQDNTTRSYRHEDSRFPGHVTGITDEAGVSYSTYAYDAQGRVASSELAGGAERLTFSYGSPGSLSTVFDASGSARSYSFVNSAGVLRPTAVSAPCPSCGSTQKSTVYDAALQPTKQIAHDGSVTFSAYDTKGRETERATFASSYAGSTTRPALNLASKVVSTQWHATFNLPTQVAEPNKTTANTYNAKGLLTAQSWTATTDATGAAKFTAVKTGSTYATTWSYSASNLATTILTKETAAGATVAVETGRWTHSYSALGDQVQVKDVTANKASQFSTVTPVGMPLTGVAQDGRAFTLQYDARGQVKRLQLGTYAVDYTFNQIGKLTGALASDGGSVTVSYDSSGRLTTLVKNGITFYSASTPATQRAAFSAVAIGNSADLAAAGAALPIDVPLPAPSPGIRVPGISVPGFAAGCSRLLGTIGLLLTPSSTSACDVVYGKPPQCPRKCQQATPQNIRAAVAGSSMRTQQQYVSASVTQSYVDFIEGGGAIPPIKVDGDVIIDGNHRFIAGLLCREIPITIPGTANLTAPKYFLRDIIVDP